MVTERNLPPHVALQVPQSSTPQVYTSQGLKLHCCIRGPSTLMCAQAEESMTEVSLALAMHTACLLVVPPPHLAEQLPQGVYSQCGSLQPKPLQSHIKCGCDQFRGVMQYCRARAYIDIICSSSKYSQIHIECAAAGSCKCAFHQLLCTIG